MIFLKRTVPIAIAFTIGLWFWLQYYVPSSFSDWTLTKASSWLKILVGIAYALGLYSLSHLHFKRIRRRVPGYGYSILVYLGLGATLYLGLAGELRKGLEIVFGHPVAHHRAVVRPAADFKAETFRTRWVAEGVRLVSGELASGGRATHAYAFSPKDFDREAARKWLKAEAEKTDGKADDEAHEKAAFEAYGASGIVLASWQEYGEDGKGEGANWIYSYVYNAAAATMFSILAFFIASAAYRTFRARSWEAAILLVAAGLVMFGRVPISGALSHWFPDISNFIMQVPQMAAKRGIILGVVLGSIATALRIIFGIERAYLGGGE